MASVFAGSRRRGRSVRHVWEQLVEHRFSRDARSEPIAGTHQAKSLPLAELGGQRMQAGRPFWAISGRKGLGGQVEPRVKVGREAGERLSLLVDAALHQLSRWLANL
jgi:hypothetical protein